MPLAQQYTTSVRPNLNWPTNSSAVCGISQSLWSSPMRWATASTWLIPWIVQKKKKKRERCKSESWTWQGDFSLSTPPRNSMFFLLLFVLTWWWWDSYVFSSAPLTGLHSPVITNLKAYKALPCLTVSSQHTPIQEKCVWERLHDWMNKY